MQAKKKEIRVLSAQDLSLERSQLGKMGSMVDHQKMSFPEKKKKTIILEGTAEEAARTLMERLHREAKVL